MDNIEEEKQQSTLDRINQKLRDFFMPGTKLSSQEETIMNIIYKILNAQGTIKLTPRIGPYYLINHNIRYYVRIEGNSVTIKSPLESVTKNCSSNFVDYVERAIDQSINRDVEKFEDSLFNAELEILKRMEGDVNE